MKFSIVTPSLNQLAYLKRCVASVADQEGVDIEHIVMDGGSTDGSVDWLAEQSCRNCPGGRYRLTFVSEPDAGMYDALNKGFAAASGDLFAWLNCDEQYLPGALKSVAQHVTLDSDADILFGGMLLVAPDGRVLACRKAMPMRRIYLEASYLYNFSCSMFVRAPFWRQVGGFDTSFKNAGDEEWMRRALAGGARSAEIDGYLAAFTYGGSNLSSCQTALQEHIRLKQQSGRFIRMFRAPINVLRVMEKACRGGGRQKGPVSFLLYNLDAQGRVLQEENKPSCRWPDEPLPYLLSHRLK